MWLKLPSGRTLAKCKQLNPATKMMPFEAPVTKSKNQHSLKKRFAACKTFTVIVRAKSQGKYSVFLYPPIVSGYN